MVLARAKDKRRVENILIIDDDPTGTELLITLLQIDGHRARKLENWQDPLSDVEKFCPALVIIDVRLRTRNGLELLGQIRTHPDPDLARTPVLMISAEDYRVECRQASADGFLLKPFSLEDLGDAVKRIEEGSGLGN
jgi:DNA-binding response OmpR family regulator